MPEALFLGVREVRHLRAFSERHTHDVSLAAIWREGSFAERVRDKDDWVRDHEAMLRIVCLVERHVHEAPVERNFGDEVPRPFVTRFGSPPQPNVEGAGLARRYDVHAAARSEPHVCGVLYDRADGKRASIVPTGAQRHDQFPRMPDGAVRRIAAGELHVARRPGHLIHANEVVLSHRSARLCSRARRTLAIGTLQKTAVSSVLTRLTRYGTVSTWHSPTAVRNLCASPPTC